MPSWLTAVSHRHGQQTKWVCHTNIQQPTNTLECYVLVACGQLATQHINFRDPPKDTSSTVAAGVQLQLRLQLPLDKNTCQSLWTVQGKTDTTTDLKFPPTANLVKCEPFAQVTDKLKKLVWKYLAFIPSDEKAWTQTILDVKCYTPTFQSVKHEHVPTPQWDVTEMCRGAADKGRLVVAMEPWWFTASAKAEESNLLQLINDRLSLSRGNQTQTCIPENEMERERGCGGQQTCGNVWTNERLEEVIACWRHDDIRQTPWYELSGDGGCSQGAVILPLCCAANSHATVKTWCPTASTLLGQHVEYKQSKMGMGPRVAFMNSTESWRLRPPVYSEIAPQCESAVVGWCGCSLRALQSHIHTRH